VSGLGGWHRRRQADDTAGLNWYVNRNVGFMLNYLHGTLTKQASATNAADAGSTFGALAMRSSARGKIRRPRLRPSRRIAHCRGNIRPCSPAATPATASAAYEAASV
jgi:hypothetical protein